MQLEFTTTATRRAGILRDTYASFAAHLRGVDLRRCVLHLNIDPVPATGDGDAVAAAAAEFFGEVRVHAPPSASFPAAVKWCWTQPAGDLFFHLEDDWLLLEPVDLAGIREALEADTDLACVHLRAYSTREDGRICLAPGLWRTCHARTIAERLVLDANPERQLRPPGINNPHGGKHAGFRGLHYPPSRVVLKDIGRPWMHVNGLRRDKGRDFITWA